MLRTDPRMRIAVTWPPKPSSERTVARSIRSTGRTGSSTISSTNAASSLTTIPAAMLIAPPTVRASGIETATRTAARSRSTRVRRLNRRSRFSTASLT